MDELREFSLETNNYPWTNTEGLRNRFNKWKRIRNIINGRQGYQELTDTELTEINNTEPTTTNTTIDIPPEITETSFNELTPLLGEGAIATTGTVATDGLATTAAIGIGGTAIIGGTAYGIKKLIERTKEKGAVLPNSEYIGPGNPIPISAAKNKPDQIAKDHDVAYGKLIERMRQTPMTEDEFAIELHKLDQTAIDEFEKEYKESGSWNAWIGAKGLKIKQKIEKHTGPLYPKYKTEFHKDDVMDTLRTTTVSPKEIEDISKSNKHKPKHISHRVNKIIQKNKTKLNKKQMEKLYKLCNEYVTLRDVIIVNHIRTQNNKEQNKLFEK